MKIHVLLAVTLFSISMPAHAGWQDYYAAVCTGFKSIFSYSYVRNQQRSQSSADLKDMAVQVKNQARKNANDALVQEIQKPQLSNYFCKNTLIGVFNTTEAAFLLNELKQRKEEALKALESNEGQESSGKSEKVRKITDMRELPALGKSAYNNQMNKYFLSFAANLTPLGRSVLRVSLIERSTGFKRMQNRETGIIEDIACTKKLLKVMAVGAENEKQQFEWQRIANDANQSVDEQIDQEILEHKEKQKSLRFAPVEKEYRTFPRWNYSEKLEHQK